MLKLKLPGWDFIDKNITKALWIPLTSGVGTWMLNIAQAVLDDGTIDDTEFHTLLQGASSLQTVALVAVMAWLKTRGKR